MSLAPGDYVKTKDGIRGKVVHISRLTVFVAFPRKDREDFISAQLESNLEKIPPPGVPFENNPPPAHL
jgi:preprotein translocase subunit YajC